jgi:hypothetical protein
MNLSLGRTRRQRRIQAAEFLVTFRAQIEATDTIGAAEDAEAM